MCLLLLKQLTHDFECAQNKHIQISCIFFTHPEPYLLRSSSLFVLGASHYGIFGLSLALQFPTQYRPLVGNCLVMVKRLLWRSISPEGWRWGHQKAAADQFQTSREECQTQRLLSLTKPLHR